MTDDACDTWRKDPGAPLEALQNHTPRRHSPMPKSSDQLHQRFPPQPLSTAAGDCHSNLPYGRYILHR